MDARLRLGTMYGWKLKRDKRSKRPLDLSSRLALRSYSLQPQTRGD
jgi:hypothetical protein